MKEKFSDPQKLADVAREIRLSTLEALVSSGASFAGSCMSVIDILTALYFGQLGPKSPVMKYFADKPGSDEQDFLVYAKGHASAALYASLAKAGFFDQSELKFLGKPNALLTSRPSQKIPGVCASVHSVGSGLSIALGMALALKMDRRPNKVFTVLGDGELQSGQVWESAMMASYHRLDNLTVLIDNNKIQSGSRVSSIIDVGSIQDKFESFGWKVIQVTDGHNFDYLLNAFDKAFTVSRRPVCIWCRTVSGKGIPFAEGKEAYHNSGLSSQELSLILNQDEAIN
jgi:transketolase